jgi:hypothetical protein
MFGGTEENDENPGQDSQSLGRYLIPGLPNRSQECYPLGRNVPHYFCPKQVLHRQQRNSPDRQKRPPYYEFMSWFVKNAQNKKSCTTLTMANLLAKSVVSDYRFDDRVRSPAEEEDFSSNLHVQTSSRPTQPPIQWVPGSFLRGLPRPRRDADHLVPRSRMSSSYTSTPPRT